jgi:hypothetical protein
MGIKSQPPTGRRYIECRQHHGRARAVGQLHLETAFLEQLLQQVRVAAHRGVVTGHVGNGDELQELVEDGALVLCAPGGDAVRLGRGGDSGDGDSGDERERQSTDNATMNHGCILFGRPTHASRSSSC